MRKNLISYIFLTVLPVSATDLPDLETMLKAKVETASKYEQTIGQAPSSVSIVTSEEIQRYGDRTLADVLRRQHGFYLTYDRNYQYLGVRGFGRHTDYNNRILILINGHRMNENLFDSAYIGSALGINLAAVERIEIVRGPGSALYGSSAMFGVINIITKKGERLDGVSGSLEGGSSERSLAELEYGGVRDALSWSFSGQYLDSAGEDLYFEEYDQPTNNNGVAEGLDYEQSHSLFMDLSYKGFQFQAFQTKRRKGIPTGAFFTEFNHPNTFTENQHFFANLSYSKKLNARSRIYLRAAFDNNRFTSSLPQDFGFYRDTFFNKSNGQWWSFEGRWQWDGVNGNRLVTGFEYVDHTQVLDRSADSQFVYFEGDFPHQRISYFVQDEYAFSSNLSLTLGLRYDHHTLGDSRLSPRLALNKHWGTTHTFKVLIGEAFRSPNVYETFYELDGIHEVNPDLKSERIEFFELVWEYHLARDLFATTSAYIYEMENLIEVGGGIGSPATFINRSIIQSHGLEASLQYRSSNKDMSGYFSAAYQHAEERDAHLTNSPHQIFKGGVNLPMGPEFNVSFTAVHEASRKTLYRSKTSNNTVADCRFESTLGKHLNLSLLVKNVFNENYKIPGGYEHASLPSGIVQDGRTYFLQLRFDY